MPGADYRLLATALRRLPLALGAQRGVAAAEGLGQLDALGLGRLQLGRTYDEQETARIVAFLRTLTGEQPSFPMPILPPSSNATPAPQPFGAPE